MTFKQLREEVLDNIRECLCSIDVQGTDEQEEFQEDIDFWLDPEIVLYNSELGSDEIEAASYDDIELDDDYLGLFLSEDVLKTYLSTRDFALVVGVSEVKADEMLLCIGAVDRSTGVAMINANNLLDTEALTEFAKVAIKNANTAGEKEPIQRKYQLVMKEDAELDTPQRNNSKRRLISLLSAIDQHVLSSFLGKEVRTEEDL
jgi:hypothetical protein